MGDIVGSTAHLRAVVEKSWPDVSADAVKVGVVLSVVHRCRLLDICMKEYVHILYCIEGGNYMRAHNGTLFLYSNGAYKPFVGIFTVSTLTRVQKVLLRVEGLLRLLSRGIARTQRSVLSAALELLRAPPNDEVWLQKIEDAVLDAPAEDSDMPSWTKTLAGAVAKCSQNLQLLLAGKRIVPFLIEWCNTPLVKTPGFACNDACFVFDSNGVIMSKVAKAFSQHIYMHLPHEWHSSVDISHVERVMRFLTTTFYQNKPALECQFAAIALVLRGRNLDRAFWTIGSGGVGQSLFSHLIAAVFGDNHAFVDLNMYFTDDELRKQGELLANKVVVTGQEMPNQSKEMREDLYKKHISGDAVSVRLPYAVVTKQVEMYGWNRFEMNNTPKFRSATVVTFKSIMRRSLCVELIAEFVSRTELTTRFPHGGSDEQGVFLKDDSLKDFLKSSPAVVAFLRLLEGFLKEKSEQACRDIIEGYVVGGGDKGLTEQVMRVACGLESVNMHPQAHASGTPFGGAGGHVPGTPCGNLVAPQSPAFPALTLVPPPGAPTLQRPAPRTPRQAVVCPGTPGTPRQAPAPAPETSDKSLPIRLNFIDRQRLGLRQDHMALVRLCLAEGYDLVNKHNVPRITASIWKAQNQRDRADIFERLLHLGFWRELPKRNYYPHPCIPVIETTHPFSEALPLGLPEAFVGLTEAVSAKAVQAFLSNDARATNDSVMLMFLERMVKTDRSRGRATKERQAATKEWAERSEKMQKHVSSVTLLRHWSRQRAASRHATSSPRSQSDMVSLVPKYAHAVDTWGRCYGQGLCFQNLSRRVRGAVCGIEVQDWDISNCMFTLVTQVVERLQLNLHVQEVRLPMWKMYASDPEKMRDLVAEAFGLDAKAEILRVGHGGGVTISGIERVDNFLAGVSREARLLRWLAASMLPQAHKFFIDNLKNTRGRKTLFSIIFGPRLRISVSMRWWSM